MSCVKSRFNNCVYVCDHMMCICVFFSSAWKFMHARLVLLPLCYSPHIFVTFLSYLYTHIDEWHTCFDSHVSVDVISPIYLLFLFIFVKMKIKIQPGWVGLKKKKTIDNCPWVTLLLNRNDIHGLKIQKLIFQQMNSESKQEWLFSYLTKPTST